MGARDLDLKPVLGNHCTVFPVAPVHFVSSFWPEYSHFQKGWVVPSEIYSSSQKVSQSLHLNDSALARRDTIELSFLKQVLRTVHSGALQKFK